MEVLFTNLVLLLIGVIIGYSVSLWERHREREHTTLANRMPWPEVEEEPITAVLPVVSVWMDRECEDTGEKEREEAWKRRKQGPEESAV